MIEQTKIMLDTQLVPGDKKIVSIRMNGEEHSFAVDAKNVFINRNISLVDVIKDVYSKLGCSYGQQKHTVKVNRFSLRQPLKRTDLNIYMNKRED